MPSVRKMSRGESNAPGGVLNVFEIEKCLLDMPVEYDMFVYK